MWLNRLTRVWLAALTGVCGALFLLAVPSSDPAFADAITDLERGSQAWQEGNYRAALVLITRGIESSELDDGNPPVAYNNRCTVFNSLLRLDREAAAPSGGEMPRRWKSMRAGLTQRIAGGRGAIE